MIIFHILHRPRYQYVILAKYKFTVILTINLNYAV
nr:MAG TPA: hypothetical protein [Bacteriophage sp.]